MYSKYHGCGNDFILGIFDENIDYSDFAIRYCNRYTGVGADGVILVNIKSKNEVNQDIKYEMVFYNADGSRAPMCGNGIRCFCKYIYDENIDDSQEYKVETLGGIMNVKIETFDPFMVKIDLGRPVFSVEKLDIDFSEKEFRNQDIIVGERKFNVDCVYMATHHLVTIVDSIDEITEKEGYELCNYKKFLKKMNVNFVEIIDNENVKVKTYERGVGFTKACGTGGAASFVILNEKKLVKNVMKNHLEYGVLKYEKNGENILMTGPSEKVCKIKF